MAEQKVSVQTFGVKKTAVAVAYCKRGRGLIKINGCPIELVEPEVLRYKVFEPILLLGSNRFSNVDIRVRVKGGGYTSQIYAIRQAISKALVAYYQKCEFCFCLQSRWCIAIRLILWGVLECAVCIHRQGARLSRSHTYCEREGAPDDVTYEFEISRLADAILFQKTPTSLVREKKACDGILFLQSARRAESMDFLPLAFCIYVDACVT